MNKLLRLLTAALLLTSTAFAQTQAPTSKPAAKPATQQKTTPVKDKKVVEIVEEVPFVISEEMPNFDGKYGLSSFRNWCQTNVKYPVLAAENGIQGKVHLSFTIQPDGKLTDAKLERGVSRELDEQALSLVRNAPALWTPAKQRGKPVKVRCAMAIDFILEN